MTWRTWALSKDFKDCKCLPTLAYMGEQNDMVEIYKRFHTYDASTLSEVFQSSDTMNISSFQELPPSEFKMFKQTPSTLKQRKPGMSFQLMLWIHWTSRRTRAIHIGLWIDKNSPFQSYFLAFFVGWLLLVSYLLQQFASTRVWTLMHISTIFCWLSKFWSHTEKSQQIANKWWCSFKIYWSTIWQSSIVQRKAYKRQKKLLRSSIRTKSEFCFSNILKSDILYKTSYLVFIRNIGYL